MSHSDDNEVRVPWQDLFRRIDGFVADRENHFVVEREVVPIIFVPGFLGSRLRTAAPDERTGKVAKVWDPDKKTFMATAYSVAVRPQNFRQKLRERKALLLGGDEYSEGRLVPYTDENAHNWRNIPSYRFPGAVARGWGGVSWTHYGGVLTALQTALEPVAEPVRHCFEFPVHAFGYDWTQPAEVTASELVGYVRETVQSYKRAAPGRAPRQCDHVVFVTHSMGGLVAREATRQLGADEVLGAVHCGQPATGTPSAYWRMKAGVERPSGVPARHLDWVLSTLRAIDDKFALSGRVAAWVLGPYGEAVTSLLGNMPGALTLLPSDAYRDARGRAAWLRYPGPSGLGSRGYERAWPVKSVYDDVYLEERAFYKLIEKAWLVLADPKSEEPVALTERLMGRAWRRYTSHLDRARSFHERLGTGTHHPLTVQISAWGQETVDHVRFTRVVDEITWDLVKRIAGSPFRSSVGQEVTKGAGAAAKTEVKEAITSLGRDLVVDYSGSTALWARARRAFPNLFESVMDESFSGYARLGGYRARVDKDDVPTDLERTFRRAELGVGPDADLDVVYLVDLQAAGLNDTHGDGTVALSSARALAAWRDVPLTPADEPLRDSAHNELYQTATVQRATARAIQNMCFRRISDVVRGLAPAGDPPQPEAPQPEAPRGGSRRGGDGRSTPGDRPVPFRIRPRPVEGLAPPEVHRSHPPLALRPDADPDAPTAPFEGYGDAFGEDE